MAEKTASESSSRKDNFINNSNNKRRHAVMLFGADISSLPPPTRNNVVIQEQGNSIDIDIDSSNSVEASVINGILSDTNKAVGDKSLVVSFKRASKKGKAVHDRNKGKAWTEDEHLQFLAGLKKFGKGNWKNISRDFVPSRTPMQVASHAQKHFVRQSLSAKKPRSSIFDMTLADHAATSPASTSRDTSKAAPSPTIIGPAAEIRKEHPTPLPPYYLPVNPPLAAAAAAYGLPNYLGISYPVGFHYAGKSTTLTNSTMLNHPWIAYYYPKCSLV